MSRRQLTQVGLFLVAVGWGCGGTTPDQRISTSLDLIPATVRMTATIGNLSDLHEHVTIDSIAAGHPALVSRVANAVKSQFGFDLFDLDALRAAGVDPTRPISIGVLSSPSGAGVVVVPGDGLKLAETLTALHARRGAAAKQVAEHHGAPIFDVDRSQTAWIPLSRHLVVVSGIQPPDQRRQVCLDILDAAGINALSGDKRFTAIRKRLADALDNESPDLWVYATGTAGTNANRLETPVGDIGLPSMLSGGGESHQGRLLAASFSERSAALTVVTQTGRAGLAEGSVDSALRFLARVPSTPMLFAHANVNIPAAWSATDPSVGWRRAASKEARRFLGLDLDQIATDLGDGVGGIVNNVGFIGTDVVLYAGVRDSSAMAAHLDGLTARSADQPISLPFGLTGSFESGTIAGTPVKRLSLKPFLDVVVGIIDDHLVITTTATRFQAIVGGDGNVLASLPEPRGADAMKTDQFILSMDADAVATQIGPLLSLVPALPSVSGRTLDLLSLFDDGALAATTTDGVYVSHFSLSRAEGGLWPELIDRVLAGLNP